jgi:hypothetical protein
MVPTFHAFASSIPWLASQKIRNSARDSKGMVLELVVHGMSAATARDDT